MFNLLGKIIPFFFKIQTFLCNFLTTVNQQVSSKSMDQMVYTWDSVCVYHMWWKFIFLLWNPRYAFFHIQIKIINIKWNSHQQRFQMVVTSSLFIKNEGWRQYKSNHQKPTASLTYHAWPNQVREVKMTMGFQQCQQVNQNKFFISCTWLSESQPEPHVYTWLCSSSIASVPFPYCFNALSNPSLKPCSSWNDNCSYCINNIWIYVYC